MRITTSCQCRLPLDATYAGSIVGHHRHDGRNADQRSQRTGDDADPRADLAGRRPVARLLRLPLLQPQHAQCDREWPEDDAEETKHDRRDTDVAGKRRQRIRRDDRVDCGGG